VNRTSLNVAGNVSGSIAVGALVGLAADQLGFRDITHLQFGTSILLWTVFGGVLGWFRRSLLSACAVLVVVLLFVLTATPLAAGLAAGWVRDDGIRHPLDAVVVLSSGMKSDSLLDPVGTERLLMAIEVARATGTTRLVTTRARYFLNGEMMTTEPGQRRLLELARFDSGWAVVDSVFSTRDEAVQSARLLLPAAKRVAVVTSPMHTRRACATFERVGFDVTCIAAREIANVTRKPLSPEDRLAAWRAWVYEHLGMVKYRWKGWVA
jgi:uncharacterized SAM-binding protein YcdF (DUF218 family)